VYQEALIIHLDIKKLAKELLKEIILSKKSKVFIVAARGFMVHLKYIKYCL